MAATAEGTLLTARHRRVQAGITARTLRLVAATWPLLDLRRLDDTAPGWAAQALGLLRGGHALSARAAMSYFAAYRLAEGATGSPPDVVAPALDLEAARTSLLVTGPVAIKQATGRGTGIEQAGRDALSRVLASSQRHVQAGGRGVIVEAVRRDRQALGWARVASADACAFCGMLASRGAVYKSEDSGEFEAHDGCGCDVEAAYSGWQPPESSLLWEDRYVAANGGDEEFRAQRLEAFRAGRVPPPRGKHTPQQLRELAAYMRSGRA